MRKLIILEVNEVPHRIYSFFKENHPNAALTKLLDRSESYTTISSDKGELHPWSTWPTFYRGIDNTIHGIKDIGENLETINNKFPPIWDILVRNRVSSGIFSSLHTHPLPRNIDQYDFLIPDPFANGSETHPSNVEPFQAFNLSMTKKSGRSVDKGIDKKSALKLAIALPTLGVRGKTILKTVYQLISEKIKPWRATRRRSFQSILAFDLYLKLLKKHKPSFTTFFTNHIASAMHRYWAANFPRDYKDLNLPSEWINRYKDEIPFCLDELNQMVESLLTFIRKNPEYKLIIASSMGQAATKAELIKSEVFFGDVDRFLEYFSSHKITALSAMHPQYNFKIDQSPDSFEAKLRSIHINDSPLTFRRKEESFFSIDLGYPNVENLEVKIGNIEIDSKELGIEIKEIDDQSGGTAYHIPEGSFFVYDHLNPVTNVKNLNIDLRSVAPAILRYFDITPSKYMKFDEELNL
ncbi:MAG: hypothetical protein JXR03_06825 [Cyclobacteriaceae bacterium]